MEKIRTESLHTLKKADEHILMKILKITLKC